MGQGVCIQGVRQGVCIQRGAYRESAFRGTGQTSTPRHAGYYRTQSTSRQYASYWNAFLLAVIFSLSNFTEQPSMSPSHISSATSCRSRIFHNRWCQSPDVVGDNNFQKMHAIDKIPFPKISHWLQCGRSL